MNSKIYKLIVTVVISLGISSKSFTWAAAYSGGTGIRTDPYRISTPSDLNTIGLHPEDWGSYFKLTTNINMAGLQIKLIGNYSTKFTGGLDGQGYTIYNLTYNNTSSIVDFIGLIGRTFDAEIRNVNLLNINIKSVGRYIGGLVGYSEFDIIENCYVTGTITGSGKEDYYGGLIGYATASRVGNCHTNININAGQGSNYVGGLIGYNNSNIYDSSSKGNVYGEDEVGGFIGRNISGIYRCFSNCIVGTPSWTAKYIGGFVAFHGLNLIENSYSKSVFLEGGDAIYKGGFAGYIDRGDLKNCFAENTFYKYGTGGYLFGDRYTGSYPGKITKCVSNQPTKISCDYLTMGWDFTNEISNGTNDIWRMCEDGVDFPHLAWEYSNKGDFTCPDGIALEDFAILSSEWNHRFRYWLSAELSKTDINYNGKVDISDLILFIENWLSYP